MPSHSATRTLGLAAALAVAVCFASTGCGADTVRQRSYDSAEDSLRSYVSETAACVTGVAPEMLSAAHETAVVDTLSACAGTTVFNQDIDQLPDTRPVSVRQSSAALSGVVTGDQLHLTFYTQSSGLTQSGVTQYRTILATCWDITVAEDSSQTDEISGIPCGDALIERMNPTEVVQLHDLNIDQR